MDKEAIERRRLGVWTREDLSPKKPTYEGYVSPPQTEDCGYDSGSNMSTRAVEPTDGSGSNPIFVGTQPDSVRLGTKKMVARIIIQHRPEEVSWQICRTHGVVCFVDSDGKARDWCNQVHGDNPTLIRFPYPEKKPCQLERIDAATVVNMFDQCTELAYNLAQIREAFERAEQEGGPVRSVTKSVQDYRHDMHRATHAITEDEVEARKRRRLIEANSGTTHIQIQE